MTMNRKSRETWALYCRSYLLTVGLLMMAGLAFTIYLGTSGSIVLPWWGIVIVGALLLGGATMIGIGLLGSQSRVDKWADAASSHEASIILTIISLPTYLLLKRFYRSR